MKLQKIILVVLIMMLWNSCTTISEKNTNIASGESNIIKKHSDQWVRISPLGSIGLTFYEDGTLEADFGLDNVVEVKTRYIVQGDTIFFVDESGVTCPDTGVYKIYQSDYYYSLDLIEDNCGGRIKFITGFWTKPDYKDLLNQLQSSIAGEDSIKAYLNRARLYMAIGEPKLGLKDFDEYLKWVTIDARAYINRAGTKMPDDLVGVIEDCEKGIRIDPENKYAYFLRGLARYNLDQRKEACEDFETAIKLGFSVLRIAEQEKCGEYWQD